MGYLSCALTGHREINDLDENALHDCLEQLLKQGCYYFYCGMAYGFDLTACKILTELKSKYSFILIACIPFLKQKETFSKKDALLYGQMLSFCEEKIILSQNYTRGCYQTRNRYMVDRADVVLAYLREEKTGTAYTVNYAKKLEKPIIFV